MRVKYSESIEYKALNRLKAIRVGYKNSKLIFEKNINAK